MDFKPIWRAILPKSFSIEKSRQIFYDTLFYYSNLSLVLVKWLAYYNIFGTITPDRQY